MLGLLVVEKEEVKKKNRVSGTGESVAWLGIPRAPRDWPCTRPKMISPRPSLASQRWVQHGPGEPLTFSHSRVLSVKRADGEYLSREDVQFDFLNAIFSSNGKFGLIV